MKLIIDTTDNTHVRLALVDKSGKLLAKSSAPAFRQQGEKLLPALAKLLAKHNLTLKAISSIEVANGTGSFSSLRIGVATAKGLGLALNVPVADQEGKHLLKEGIQVVNAAYTGEANIGPLRPVDK